MKEEEELYNLCSENKGDDQLGSHRKAGLRRCFRIYRLFSYAASHMVVKTETLLKTILNCAKTHIHFIHSEIIYLFGGWDGNEDLADMWAYHIPRRQWICVSKNAAEEVTLVFQRKKILEKFVFHFEFQFENCLVFNQKRSILHRHFLLYLLLL